MHLVPSAAAQALAFPALCTWLWCMMMAALWRAHRGHRDPVLILGVLAAAILAPTKPGPSRDVLRYLWDGAVVVDGHDPYRLPPNDGRLEHLRPLWPTPAEHDHVVTIYPPAAMASFAMAATVGPAHALWVWKLLLWLVAVGTMLIMRSVLDATGRANNLAVVTLNPLILGEGVAAGHVDLWAAAGLALALLWLAKGRRHWLAGVWLGAAALFKPIAVFAGAAMARDRRQLTGGIAGSLAIVGVAYGLALAAGMQPLGSVVQFIDGWRGGNPLPIPGRLGVALGIGAAVAITLWPKRPGWSSAWLYIAMAIPLVLSPVVFPWYLLPLVPALALRPSAFGLGWQLTLPFIYEADVQFVSNGVWSPATWPLVLIAAGWCIGLFIDWRLRIDAA